MLTYIKIITFFIKESIWLGLLIYSFVGLVHYNHGGKQGNMQVETVVEKELRVHIYWPTGKGK